MEIKQSMDRIKKVEKILANLKFSKNSRRTWEQKVKKLLEFRQGNQWNVQAMPAWMPKPVTNYIHLAITYHKAHLSITNPMPIVVAEHPQFEWAKDNFQHAIEHVWNKQDIRLTVRESIEQALIAGTAIVQVTFDNTLYGGSPPIIDPVTGQVIFEGNLWQGEVVVRPVPILNFYPDPSAVELENMQFVAIETITSLDTVKSDPRYIEFLGETNIKRLTKDNLSLSDALVLDEEQKTAMEDESSSTVIVYEYYERYRENGQWKMDMYHVLGNVMLLHVEDVRPAQYPYAILYDFRKPQSFYGMSIAELILDKQILLNKLEQMIALIGLLASSPQKEVLKASNINPKEVALAGQMPNKVWVSAVANGIRNIESPDIPQGLFKLIEDTKADIREIAGLTEAFMGNAVGSLTTSSGVQSLINQSSIPDQDRSIEVDHFIKQIGKLMLEQMKYNYTEKRWFRYTDPTTGKMMYSNGVLADAIDTDLDIVMQAGASSAITKDTLENKARQLLELQGQYQFQPPVITQDEVLEMLNIPANLLNKIKARINKERQISMQQQAMLQGDNAQQVSPQPTINQGMINSTNLEAMSRGK